MLGSIHGPFTAIYRRVAALSTMNLPPAGGGEALPFVPSKTIVIVGLMGAGKTNIGKRLALRLNLPFRDADSEIEAAAGLTIEEIFQRYGEAVFRDGERRVIARLLDEPTHVLSTGGGSFMDPATRARISERGISIWLRAELDLLVARVARRGNRPLLKVGEPREILARLIEQRHPVYAGADITVDCLDGPPELTLARVIEALQHYIAASPTAVSA
jgi:shikimate kinase